MSILTPAPDKQLHFMVGGAIALVFGLALGVVFGGLAAVLAGAGKEAADWCGNRWRARSGLPPNHDVDIWDFAATVSGGFVALVSISIVKVLV